MTIKPPILPVEPDEQMLIAGARILGGTMHADNQAERARQVWAAMAHCYCTGELPLAPTKPRS